MHGDKAQDLRIPSDPRHCESPQFFQEELRIAGREWTALLKLRPWHPCAEAAAGQLPRSAGLSRSKRSNHAKSKPGHAGTPPRKQANDVWFVAIATQHIRTYTMQVTRNFGCGPPKVRRVGQECMGLMPLSASGIQKRLASTTFGEGEEHRTVASGQTRRQPKHLSLRAA
jgi:hypothetical protein